MNTDNPEGDRIAKVLSRAGVASRRDAERMILDGRVKVNGKVVTSPALNVTAADRIAVDGVPVAAAEPTRVWLYHKPPGVVTTTADEQGRETVFDGLPEDMPRVMSIGRLDLTSEGLLLLTNDGEVKRRLELPSTGWLRRYRVRINGSVSEPQLELLRAGVTVEDVEYAPMEVQFDRQQGANAWLTVGLREGKNREIRRVMEFLGVTVNRLIRVSYGPFQLGEMAPGTVKEVARKVLREQLGIGPAGDEQVLTRRARGERPVKVKKLRTGPVMRSTKGGPRPGEGGGAPRPKVAGQGTGDAPGAGPRGAKPARAGRTADRPGWSPDKAAAVDAARAGETEAPGGFKPRSAGFKSHRPVGEGEASRGPKVAGAARSAGYKSHRATGGGADDGGPRKGAYKPRGPVTGGRGEGEGYKPRGPRVEGEGYKSRGPKPAGEGYKPRGPRVEGEGYKSRGPKPAGEGYKPRGPRVEGEGYKPRGPKPAGEGFKPRGPRVEGEGYKSRGPKPAGEGYKPRGPRVDAGPRPEAAEGDKPRKARHTSKAAGFKSHEAGGAKPSGEKSPAGGKKPRE